MMAKAVLDRGVAALLLVLLSPVFALLAILVRVRLGAPVLFKQQRTGFRGRPFVLYKFRTMADLRDEKNEPLPDEQRLTPLGHFFRRYSLDELPALLNVIRGDLSLVGPRPFMHKYWANGLYTPEQARRYEVMPGITGWAQINGRNSLTWEEKFAYDLWYVEHRTFWLDLRILVQTTRAVLTGIGVSEHGHVTSGEFRGTTSS